MTHAREMLGTYPGTVVMMDADALVECIEAMLRLFPVVYRLRRRLPRRGDGRPFEALHYHVPQLLGRVRNDG